MLGKFIADPSLVPCSARGHWPGLMVTRVRGQLLFHLNEPGTLLSDLGTHTPKP